MKFGLFGGAQAQVKSTTDDSAHGYAEYVDYTLEAEDLGYHSTFLVEHHFTGVEQLSASLNLLTFLAAKTSTIRLGTAVVVVPWHNPVLLAEQVATLDLLSGGRVDFGVGKGYRHNEFHGFCIPMSEAEERFEEGMAVIRRAWANTERFSHHGKYWDFEDIIVEPRPIQRPHPPFWLAAGQPASLRGAARDGYNLLLDQMATFETIGERLSTYRDAVIEAGRKFDPMNVAVARALLIAPDRETRDMLMAKREAAWAGIERLTRTPDGKSDSSMLAYSDTRTATEAGALIGTPDEIAERLERLRAQGVEYVILANGDGSRESLRLFAKEIMPAFADTAETVEA